MERADTDHPLRSGEWSRAAVAALVVGIGLCARWLLAAPQAVPEGLSPGSLADGADARLILWAMAWDARMIAAGGAGFFDANIFHPASRMLAGSDVFLTPAIMGAPLYWATGNPALSGNLVAIATYPLAAFSMYAALRWTGIGVVVAGLGGLAFALGPFRVPADVHVLQYPNFLLPMTIVAFMASDRGRVVWLAGAVALGLFTSIYAAVMVVGVLVVEGIVMLGSGGAARLPRLVLATFPAGIGFALLLSNYLGHSSDVSYGLVSLASANVGRLFQPAFLDPGHRVVGMGWPVAVLGVVGLASPWLRGRRPEAAWWRWVLLASAGWIAAMGPELYVGSWTIPLPMKLTLGTPLAVLRSFPRFFLFAHVGLVGLAAIGTQFLWERRPRKWSSGVVGTVAVVVGLLTILVPRGTTLFSSKFTPLAIGRAMPPVYGRLAEKDPGPLLIIPGPSTPAAIGRKYEQAGFMVQSTYHWRPIMNGHTGYVPWWYESFRRLRDELPSASALQTLVDMSGVRWIIVSRAHLPPEWMDRWREFAAAHSDLVDLEEVGPDFLVGVKLQPRRDWASSLARGEISPGRTILGTPRAPLAPASESAAIEMGPGNWPEVTTTGRRVGVNLVVEHRGTADWPGLAPVGADTEGLVRVTARWRAPDGTGPVVGTAPLWRDAIAGDRIAVRIEARTPDRAGDYEFVVGVEQVGTGKLGLREPFALPLRIEDPTS